MNRRRFLASIPELLALPFIDREVSGAHDVAHGTITGMTDANDVNAILDFEPIEFTEADVGDWMGATVVWDCSQNAWINWP